MIILSRLTMIVMVATEAATMLTKIT